MLKDAFVSRVDSPRKTCYVVLFGVRETRLSRHTEKSLFKTFKTAKVIKEEEVALL